MSGCGRGRACVLCQDIAPRAELLSVNFLFVPPVLSSLPHLFHAVSENPRPAAAATASTPWVPAQLMLRGPLPFGAISTSNPVPGAIDLCHPTPAVFSTIYCILSWRKRRMTLPSHACSFSPRRLSHSHHRTQTPAPGQAFHLAPFILRYI